MLKKKINIIQVNILENKLNQPYSYKADFSLYEELNYGDLVLVEFNNSFKIGFVLKKEEVLEETIKYELKGVLKILKRIEAKQSIRNIILHIKSKIIAVEKDIINLVLSKNYYSSGRLEISVKNKSILNNLDIKYKDIILKYFKAEDHVFLKKVDKNDIKYIREFYNMSIVDINLFEDKETKIMVYKYRESESQFLRKVDFLAKENISEYKFKKLLNLKDIISDEINASEYNYSKEKKIQKLELSLNQQKAYQDILSTNKITLLHGITGSGKTIIYAKLIMEYINKGKQILLLVPEVLLTLQMIEEFNNIFKEQTAVYNNSLTSLQKKKLIKGIQNRNLKIIIGTRSSIFLDIPDLDLVIVDEEHDSSYKQSAYPYYNVDIMYDYWVNKNIKIVLASATPSIISYTKALRGIYNLITLNSRYNDYKLPTINYLKYDDQNLLNDVSFKIKEKLSANEKVLILFNVKGYSKNLQCEFCGNIPICPNCKIPLKYYKSNRSLECNFCDYKEIYTEYCKKCNTKNFKENGIGIEKVYEFLYSRFKGNILRIDSNVAKTKNKANSILEEFKQNDNKILIGTQIVAKGLNIDKLDYVIVLNMDSILYFSDFSAYESGYQLLEQISGRSGRSSKTGVVDVYTNNEDHFIYKSLKKHDYKMFFNEEIKNRKLQRVVPYYYICQIEVRNKDEYKINEYLNKIKKKLNKKYEVSEIIDPYIKTINNSKRKKIYIKYKRENLKKDLENMVNEQGSLEVYIDLDIRSYGY